MEFGFDFSKEKNSILKATRGLGFEEVISAILSLNLINYQENPNSKKFPGQRVFVVKIKKYTYVVPYVLDQKRRVYFLKTFYPSRKFNKKYLKGK